MAGTTTALDIFDTAIALMDSQDGSGLSDTSENAEYKNRTLAILNTLCREIYPLSDTYSLPLDVDGEIISGVRPVFTKITNFTTAIDIDDNLANTVLPYGLAAYLLLTEDPSTASFFRQVYEENKRTIGQNGLPVVSEAIEDLYGGIGYGDYYEDE